MANELLSPNQKLKREAHRLKLEERIADGRTKRATRQSLRRATALLDQGVYVIGCAGHPVKIGVARDAVKRLGRLQTGSPHKMRIYAHMPVPPGEAFNVERACHTELVEYRLSGEWFDIDPYEAIACVRRAIDRLSE